MARIVCSLSGEGRGHATRIAALVEHLRREHDIVLLASHVAYDLLAPIYRGMGRVTLRRIPGLKFHYAGNRLSYTRSAAAAVPFLFRLTQHVQYVEQLLREERPDLAICDFEPLLPRCARRCGIPLVSFDHQHFLLVSDLSDLPWSLRWKAWLLRPSIRLCYGGAHRMIVSSFYFPPKRRRYRDAVQVGPLLRPEIESACPIQGDYVLVYVRRAMPRTLERALRECGRPVRVYGLGCREPAGNLIFCATDQSGFAADLAGCCAVVATAGNQLVGEAFYLGKPVLGLPEPGNFEQSINGYFLRASGAGESIDMGRLTPADLQEFLQRVPEYRSRLRPHQVKGNELAVAAILGELQRAQASTGLVQCAA